jgi:hypothetical protein
LTTAAANPVGIEAGIRMRAFPANSISMAGAAAHIPMAISWRHRRNGTLHLGHGDHRLGGLRRLSSPLCPDAVPQWQIEQKLHRVFSTSL